VSYWPLSCIDDVNGVRVGGEWMRHWKELLGKPQYGGTDQRTGKDGKESTSESSWEIDATTRNL